MASKLRKLLAMSPREIGFRIARGLALAWERIGYRTGRFDGLPTMGGRQLCAHVDKPPTGEQLPGWWLKHMRNRREPPFLLGAADLDPTVAAYHRLFGDQLDTLLAAADRVCRGEFSLLGLDFSADDPIAWQTDPRNGNRWPSDFHADVDIAFCQAGTGDVKDVWELNRHEFLIDCAKAFRITQDPRYMRRVCDLVGTWIETNPYLEGINWASALEVANRALSWLWAYQLGRGWRDMPVERHDAWIRSFYQHGAYLDRHLSFYFSPNNHLIGEATGLYLLGCFFPEFDESPAWRRRGWQVLSSYFKDQYYDDGGSTEQATYYHNYCLGFLLLAVLTRLRRHEPVPPEMLDCIQRALDFTMWMTRPNGRVPRIGDADDARSIRFAASPLWDFRNLLCIGAVLFERADMKAVAGPFHEDALWLFGPKGYETYQQLESAPPAETSHVFPTSGYYLMRSGWGANDHHLAFDFGPIAAGLHAGDVPSSAHGHADMLSLTLSVQGKPLLVDGGFVTYSADPDSHRYFRETPAHNTLTVDGASQAKFVGGNGWSHVATPELPAWRVGDDFELVEGSHAGFFAVDGRVRHRRAIFRSRDAYWLVLDRLEGEGEHLVEAFFHLAPGRVTPIEAGGGVSIQTDEGGRALLQLVERHALQMEIIQGGDGPDGGWIGTSYGCRVPAPVVRFHGRVNLPASFTFAIVPVRQEFESVMVESLEVPQPAGKPVDVGVGYRVCIDGEEEECAFRWETSGLTKLELHELCDRAMLAPTTETNLNMRPSTTNMPCAE